jgi:hypothetical protein
MTYLRPILTCPGAWVVYNNWLGTNPSACIWLIPGTYDENEEI